MTAMIGPYNSAIGITAADRAFMPARLWRTVVPGQDLKAVYNTTGRWLSCAAGTDVQGTITYTNPEGLTSDTFYVTAGCQYLMFFDKILTVSGDVNLSWSD